MAAAWRVVIDFVWSSFVEGQETVYMSIQLLGKDSDRIKQYDCIVGAKEDRNRQGGRAGRLWQRNS